ncbi:hypothetical protein EIP86_005372 [Pleurotus ostreatoroseus]|nr:hypothetical protein EIP86_005372 [Pleurotus ostreatoroseus]
MTDPTNKFIQFLDEPLPQFKKKRPTFYQTEGDDGGTSSTSAYLTVPPPRNDTTSQWRSEKLTATVIDAIFHMATHELVSPTWMPRPNQGTSPTRTLHFDGELVGESYAKSRDGKLRGVRVDKLFIMSASQTENVHVSQTRSGQETLRKLMPDMSISRNKKINSKNEYLPRGAIWRLGSFENQKAPDIEKMCKALLPIEIKAFEQNVGSLNQKAFAWLARNTVTIGKEFSDGHIRRLLDNDWISLDDEKKPQPISKEQYASAIRAIKGTLSMIGQAVRYGIHYGVDYVIITDYEHGVVLNIPEGLHSVEEKGVQLEMKWLFVKRNQLRWAVAATLWNVCDEVNAEIKKASGGKKATKS